jgi:hypothetical protein
MRIKTVSGSSKSHGTAFGVKVHLHNLHTL